MRRVKCTGLSMLRLLHCAIAALALASACSSSDSFTDLNTDGPPEILQVRLRESYRDSTSRLLDRRVFAFGSHPMATDEDAHPVSAATASRQQLRIIFDELLVGNMLEEVACRAPVDDDAFDVVPLGATPDDIAACAVPNDSLAGSCGGPRAVCLCHLDAGCGDHAKGEPVGVLDVNQDGAADNTGFRRGAVGVRCGDIDVPIDLDMSYWNPSGDQQVPAKGGFEALGPAIVLVPRDGVLPTNRTCGLTFASDVVDKQGEAVCAPPMGRPSDCTTTLKGADCEAGLVCSPGDVTAFSFKVEPLRIDFTPADGATGVNPADAIYGNANTRLSAASLAGITITGGAVVPSFTVTASLPTQVKIDFTAPLAAATTYTLTIPVTVTDTFGQALLAPIVIHFTTA